MSDTTKAASAPLPTDGDVERQWRDMNEALRISAVSQHALTERAERAEKALRAQALVLAEQDRCKDEFMAMLSHELRNPLASIAAAVQLLAMQAHGTETITHRETRLVIERQVATLTRLVDDLMDVSRVATGKFRLVVGLVDLSATLGQALDMVRPVLERRRHQLSVALPKGPVWVRGDAVRLEQIIVNLIHNAAKFTDDGGRIGVGVRVCHEQAQLRVSDSGIGLAPDMLPHIFGLFAQADRSLDRSEGGLGIGLSLVHRLVTLHGGTVEASSPGLRQGSDFVVTLPVAPPPGDSAEPRAGASEHDRVTALRVLVVDDNLDACEMLAAVVEMKGHAVEKASTGPAAIVVATHWRPDLVLLDIGLPGLNGFDVARHLRADPANKNMKLVAVTGYGRDTDRERGREAGFDMHLVKPVDITVIEQLLTTPHTRA